MELGGGFKAKHHGHFRAGLGSGEILVIKLPDKKVMRVVSRSVFLALVMLTLPCIKSIIKGVSVSELETSHGYETFKFEQLGLLFNDLAGEGLRGESDRSLIVSPGSVGIIHALDILNVVDNGFEVVMDSERKSSFENESVDFVFAFDLVDAKFVDRVLKVGGIVAVPLSNDPSNAFSQKSNYKIVYLRRYSSTFVAMRKTGASGEQQPESPDRRRLCQFGSEAKEAVLQGLEDVLLEPPRRALAKSSEYLKKMKFLPDLLGNSLENCERRVFVSVDLNEQNSGAVEWFHQNYPKMNTEFEVHNLEVEAEEEEASSKPQKDVSGWLKENVKEEDYVVMKAEAEVVVDMMQKSTICLVDELFLECNNEWWQNGKSDKSKRAYWECVALHGRLRDIGVAVHQWFL